jgi:hypothetical protein
MSASKTRLLQARRSTRSTKSKKSRYAPLVRAAASTESTAPWPTLRTAPRPKRIRFSPTTVNL